MEAKLILSGGRIRFAPAPDQQTALFFLRLIVMPLDGEEHARAEHEDLERKEDDREPIPHFGYIQALLTRSIVRDV